MLIQKILMTLSVSLPAEPTPILTDDCKLEQMVMPEHHLSLTREELTDLIDWVAYFSQSGEIPDTREYSEEIIRYLICNSGAVTWPVGYGQKSED
jgi:hypothetical protein